MDFEVEVAVEVGVVGCAEDGGGEATMTVPCFTVSHQW